MHRFLLGFVVIALFALINHQAVEGAARQESISTQEETKQDDEEFPLKPLQVMAYYGTDIWAGPGREYAWLSSVPCGTYLTSLGDQEGEWFRVYYGAVEGWVTGWETTFDVVPNYCQEPSLPAPEVQAEEVTQEEAQQPLSVGGGYADTVAAAAATYGVSFDWLWAVVGCETGYTYNLGTVGAAGEYGPFQFMESTFYWMAEMSGIGGSWYDPVDQAYVAAWAFANGYSSHWTCA